MKGIQEFAAFNLPSLIHGRLTAQIERIGRAEDLLSIQLSTERAEGFTDEGLKAARALNPQYNRSHVPAH